MKSDIFSILETEHEHISQLLEQLADTGPYGIERRMRLFTQFARVLRCHTWSEQESVYPLLRRHRETVQSYEVSMEEHTLISNALLELEAADPATDRWDDFLEQLVEDVEYHLSMEEGDLFDRMRRAIPKEELVEMARLYMLYKDRYDLEHQTAA